VSRPEGVGRISRFRHDFNKPEGSEQRRGFCRHGTIFIACWRNHGTNLRATRNLSWCRNLVEATLRSDRGTNLSRSQKFVTVQKFAGGQMSVSGCPEHDKLSRKQKTPQKP
jgi:hypothetical protein